MIDGWTRVGNRAREQNPEGSGKGGAAGCGAAPVLRDRNALKIAAPLAGWAMSNEVAAASFRNQQFLFTFIQQDQAPYSHSSVFKSHPLSHPLRHVQTILSTVIDKVALFRPCRCLFTPQSIVNLSHSHPAALVRSSS